MTDDPFNLILSQLGRLLGLQLQADKNRACVLKTKEGVEVQIEIDKREQFLLIGCDLGLIKGGKVRSLLFKEALKANGVSSPSPGVFAFNQNNRHLVLFHRVSIKGMTADKLVLLLKPLAEKAQIWKNAIQTGTPPQPVKEVEKGKGFFGLSR